MLVEVVLIYNHLYRERKTEMSKRLCDEDCNHCPIIQHHNSKMLTFILNKLHSKFGDEAYKIIQDNCPNMTVCYDCRIDDFCHIKGCKIKSKRV